MAVGLREFDLKRKGLLNGRIERAMKVAPFHSINPVPTENSIRQYFLVFTAHHRSILLLFLLALADDGDLLLLTL
jgi:hypothetical protein